MHDSDCAFMSAGDVEALPHSFIHVDDFATVKDRSRVSDAHCCKKYILPRKKERGEVYPVCRNMPLK